MQINEKPPREKVLLCYPFPVKDTVYIREIVEYFGFEMKQILAFSKGINENDIIITLKNKGALL